MPVCLMFGCSTTLQNAVFIKNKPQRLVPKGLATVRSAPWGTKPDAPKFGVSVRWRPTMSKEVPQQKTTARCSALRTTATKATVRLRGIAPSCQYTPKKQCRSKPSALFFFEQDCHRALLRFTVYGSLFFELFHQLVFFVVLHQHVGFETAGVGAGFLERCLFEFLETVVLQKV